MPKTFTLYVSTSPYSYEYTLTTVRITDAALNKGHIVNLIASADGVYCFLKKQKAKGITNLELTLRDCIEMGVEVHADHLSTIEHGLKKEDITEGVALTNESDIAAILMKADTTMIF